MVHDLLWLDDGRVRAVVSRGIESSVADLDVRTGRWTDLTINKLRVEDIEMAGRAVAAVMSGPAHPAEVYTLDGGSWTRRTNSNRWLDEVALTRQAIHRFTASDGVTIEGILLYPRDFREGTRYPLVIVAHGGPESHYGNQWVTTYSEWGQLLSREGYFVWYPTTARARAGAWRSPRRTTGIPWAANSRITWTPLPTSWTGAGWTARGWASAAGPMADTPRRGRPPATPSISPRR
jgi:dipeptidyl aminopeptidase/acylaminoacyl peptidase